MSANPTSTAVSERLHAQRDKLQLEREALYLKAHLAGELPALAAAWGDGDPVVQLVATALDSPSATLVQAAGAAVAARKVAELRGHPSTEEVAEAARGALLEPIIGPDLGRGETCPRRLLRLWLNHSRTTGNPPTVEELLPALEVEGLVTAMRVASLLNELLGEHAGGGALQQSRSGAEAHVLIEAPAAWRHLGDGPAIEAAGEPRTLGVGGFDVDAEAYRKAKLKLRSLNAGTAAGPRFVAWSELRFRKGVPGWEDAAAMITWLIAVAGFDDDELADLYAIVEDGRVVGLGGWRRKAEGEEEVPAAAAAN